ncbi:MAG TPA: YXWGXW repeat-containing protein [Candidatus Limnocylindria bacterium]|jgi:hypothetical protein|nr:YXWGXW repeat-containing protein [Candidatus Limnocylindria bacterium]
MKILVVKWVSLVALTGILAGCVDSYGRRDNTGSGALIGGASGAAIGAIADRRNPGAGALIGGVAGLITGGLIGHSVDQAEARRYPPPTYVPPPPNYVPGTPAPPPPVSVADVENLSRSGMSDNDIINRINNTHTVFHLDADAIIALKNAGVSQNVIAYMVGTANSVASQAPPPAPTETVVVPPGPDYVWEPGEWVWNGGAWVWVGGRWAIPPYRHAVWVEAHWVAGRHGWYRVPGHWL